MARAFLLNCAVTATTSALARLVHCCNAWRGLGWLNCRIEPGGGRRARKDGPGYTPAGRKVLGLIRAQVRESFEEVVLEAGRRTPQAIQGSMNLVRPALRRTVYLVGGGGGAGARLVAGVAANAAGHLPHAGHSDDLRRPALRRHGPGPDGGLPHLLLRISLPLHHRHRARGIEVHPGRGA